MGRSVADLVEAKIESGKTLLPIFDGTTKKLEQVLQQEELDVNAIEQIVSQDPVLVSAVLRLANSTFYGGLEKVTTVREAILRLGAAQVGRMATIVTQKDKFTVRSKVIRPFVGQLWRHSVACAVGSQWLVERIRRPRLATEAFLAGMLHDIGKLLVLRVIDDLMASRPGFDPPLPLILEIMGSIHTSHGESLMEKWSIPDPYPRIVRLHHEPEFDEDDTLLVAVRLVDQLCNNMGIGLERTEEPAAASAEARVLGVRELTLAELEISLEDTLELAEV